ncbi:MAG: hypothetical protein OXN89_21685 [Bryobacterales bacterium]|nr:hypothetical protein [Bryobacterales bacterium]
MQFSASQCGTLAMPPTAERAYRSMLRIQGWSCVEDNGTDTPSLRIGSGEVAALGRF